MGAFLRTRVKICGVTNGKDATSAVESGADAIGLVFYPPSPRAVTIKLAREVAEVVPAFVTIVGLFVNAEKSQIEQTVSEVGLDLLQFHGEESPDFCRQFNRPYIKAVRVKADTNLIQYADEYFDAKALLLDAYAEGVPGGTGQAFDWNLIPKGIAKPIILAGGLNETNVAQAITAVRPYAVDVSGGVEIAKGIKDSFKIKRFMQQVASVT
jgi:phosphoribosylanthranilate isomerase